MNTNADPETLNARHRDAYDRIALRFAEINAAMPPMLAESGRLFVDAVDTAAAVLELGCGAGRDLAWLAARGLNLVGADLSMGMLKQAREQVNSPLVQADMRRLPFRSGHFGGVWCNAALLHLPKPQVPATLWEIRRMLQPGGLLFASLQVGEGEVWEPWTEGAEVERFFVRYTPEAAVDLLHDAGFDLIRLIESRAGLRRHWLHAIARRMNRRSSLSL